MNDDLHVQGVLAETTVPDLYRSMIRSGETAIISLDAIGRNDTVYFQDGRLVYASSSDPDMGLADVLFRNGDLTLAQYRNALEEAVATKRMGALLIELGYLRHEELVRAAERQVASIVLATMHYRTGSYTVRFTGDFPDDIVVLPIATERLILDGIREVPYWSLISRGLGRFDRVVAQVPGVESKAYFMDLRDEENHVFSLLDQPQSIESLCTRSYLSNFVTCRSLWGLLSVGFVQDADAADDEGRRAALESEYEMEALVERYNTTYQALFAWVFQKIGDHVYDFMDRIVVRLSEASAHHLAGMSLVNEGRVDFDTLYNNLVSSGVTESVAAMHEVLNELLYGWVIEIRTEFGPEAEKQAVAIVNRGK